VISPGIVPIFGILTLTELQTRSLVNLRLELTFANYCTLSADNIVVLTPTPDCDLLEVADAQYVDDDFRVEVQNNNPVRLCL